MDNDLSPGLDVVTRDDGAIVIRKRFLRFKEDPDQPRKLRLTSEYKDVATLDTAETVDLIDALTLALAGVTIESSRKYKEEGRR